MTKLRSGLTLRRLIHYDPQFETNPLLNMKSTLRLYVIYNLSIASAKIIYEYFHILVIILRKQLCTLHSFNVIGFLISNMQLVWSRRIGARVRSRNILEDKRKWHLKRLCNEVLVTSVTGSFSNKTKEILKKTLKIIVDIESDKISKGTT